MHLLIDGKNLLYRGIYASLNTESDHFVTISRMMHSYLHKFNYKNIHVFWDDKKENLWRKSILSEYKESSCRDKPSEIEQKLIKYQNICKEIWKNMNIKQYSRNNMEADDLIYSFCYAITGDKIVISNDGDMMQLPYRFKDVNVYNPSKKKMCDKPILDPVLIKCLSGDVSDNISGYYGIGPKKSSKLASDHKHLWDFLLNNGIDTYKRNKKLIDLSLCPHKLDNMCYIIGAINQKADFNKEILLELIYNKHKIKGIMVEYKSIISPFKLIGE